MARTVAMSAIGPFVIHIFVPFITHSSPSFTAVVLVADRSEPDWSSVKHMVPIFSPLIAG